MSGRASTPEVLAEHLRRISDDEVLRARQWARWPLSADELARRAAHHAGPMDWSWQEDAADPECPDCLELGRACAGHLGAWASLRLERISDCDECGGRGRTLAEVDAVVKWRACPACNAAPVYPGPKLAPPCRCRQCVADRAAGVVHPVSPVPLSVRARPGGRRELETAAELARARAFWRAFVARCDRRPGSAALDELLE